jgi:hypothetical protein
MSRKLTPEEEDLKLQAEEELRRIKQERQEGCCHWHCHPTEWWWSNSRVRTLRCDECEAEQYFEEFEP